MIHLSGNIIMSTSRDPEGSRSAISVVMDIIDGTAWNARLLRNNSLRQHCRLLGRTFRGSHPQTNPLRLAARRLFGHVSHASDLLVATHPRELPVVPVMVRMAAYHRQWLRDPESWQPDAADSPERRLDNLARHLFARWPMPDWAGSAWLVKGGLFYLERDWFCHMGRGGSLRSAAGMPPSITNRSLHMALAAPANLTMREALRWGQVKALGGSDELLKEVLTSRMLRDLSNDAVWSRLLEKVAQAKYLDARTFGLMADTLVEAIRGEGWLRAETLVNLPLKELLAHSRKYWRTISTMGAEVLPEMKVVDIDNPRVRAELGQLVATRWTRMPATRDFQWFDESPKRSIEWQVVELTCQAQLLAESRMMRHCVSSYRRKCNSGASSIFSLRRIEDEDGHATKRWHLTMEVDRRTRRVIQVRGKYNRYATCEEFQILRKWAESCRLLI
jgi:hypothetical protein